MFQKPVYSSACELFQCGSPCSLQRDQDLSAWIAAAPSPFFPSIRTSRPRVTRAGRSWRGSTRESLPRLSSTSWLTRGNATDRTPPHSSCRQVSVRLDPAEVHAILQYKTALYLLIQEANMNLSGFELRFNKKNLEYVLGPTGITFFIQAYASGKIANLKKKNSQTTGVFKTSLCRCILLFIHSWFACESKTAMFEI